MTDPAGPRVALFCSTWGSPYEESAFVARSLAGALSRGAPVDVYTPGRAGTTVPDGAFDVRHVGTPAGAPGGAGAAARWPEPDAVPIGGCPTPDVVVAAPQDAGLAAALAARWGPAVAVGVVAPGGAPAAEGAGPLCVGMEPCGRGERRPHGAPGPVGLHVGVHPMAAERRHVGMAFTGYTLVLSDAGGDAEGEAGVDGDAVAGLGALARWVVAGFPRRVVIVVRDAVASIWRSRSLLGTVAVDSRMDLWRIVAHAALVVDAAPGPLVARECVESLRYGVPVVVPAGTPAAALAQAASGGLWYSTVAELLECVDALGDPELAGGLGAQGRAAADAWYGDVTGFVDRARRAAALLAAAATGAA